MRGAIHFEIPAFERWSGPHDYWLATKAGDRPGRLRHMGPGAGETVDVTSVDDALKRIEEKGGKVALPKMAVPGIGYLAYCMDTEGTLFGVIQMDPSAH